MPLLCSRGRCDSIIAVKSRGPRRGRSPAIARGAYDAGTRHRLPSEADELIEVERAALQ